MFTPDEHFTGKIDFKYQAKDHDGALSDEVTVLLTLLMTTITPPCQYTIFGDAQECGIEDCTGVMSPVGMITPSSHTDDLPIYYYQEGAGVCWKSTGNSTGSDWEVEVNGNIFDININQSVEVIVKNIRFDEGGEYENAQTLSIKSATTSNKDILRLDNICFNRWQLRPLGLDDEADVVKLGDGETDDIESSGLNELLFKNYSHRW